MSIFLPLESAYRRIDHIHKPTLLTHTIQHLVQDIILFNRYLLVSRDTYQLLLLSAPLYMAGRALDAPLHDYFYNKEKHRNRHEIAPVFKYSVDPVMGVSIATLLVLQFLSHDLHTRIASEVFTAGLCSLLVYKHMLKEIPFKGAIRPKNEHFSAVTTYYGGFPSGHVWQITFMAYLFAREFGLPFGIPLTAFALVVGVQSVAINRHTVSQVVAGAALGVVFGVAGHKVVRYALQHASGCGIIINGLHSVSCTFEKKF